METWHLFSSLDDWQNSPICQSLCFGNTSHENLKEIRRLWYSTICPQHHYRMSQMSQLYSLSFSARIQYWLIPFNWHNMMKWLVHLIKNSVWCFLTDGWIRDSPYEISLLYLFFFYQKSTNTMIDSFQETFWTSE